MTRDSRFRNLEQFGFGPNVMKKTKICAKCGQIAKQEPSSAADAEPFFHGKPCTTATDDSTPAVPDAVQY